MMGTHVSCRHIRREPRPYYQIQICYDVS
uniref:Uncharacterized protein n=1 Tax=Rhizophora mucronata TaxID=61149 RepID=A0A2P2QV64_RHIMU